MRTRSPAIDPDLGSGDGAVVRHRVDEHARRGLPRDLGRGQVEHLHAVLDPRLERLVALTLGLGREGGDPGLVTGEHVLGAHGPARGSHRPGRAGSACSFRRDHQGTDHAGVLVARDRAERLVGPGPERGDLERRARARLDLGRLLHALTGVDGEGVGRRPVVRHLEGERLVDRRVDHRRADRELRQRDLEARRGGGGPGGPFARRVAAPAGAGGGDEQQDQSHGRRSDRTHPVPHPGPPRSSMVGSHDGIWNATDEVPRRVGRPPRTWDRVPGSIRRRRMRAVGRSGSPT